jgi:hypothetical protein
VVRQGRPRDSSINGLLRREEPALAFRERIQTILDAYVIDFAKFTDYLSRARLYPALTIARGCASRSVAAPVKGHIRELNAESA